MTQWVREFHTWWPPFRVALLHGSGTHIGPRADIINAIAKKGTPLSSSLFFFTPSLFLTFVVGHILITTYEGIRINQEQLLKHRWEYLVMDEGHKIRNPDAEITITCKKFPVSSLSLSSLLFSSHLLFIYFILFYSIYSFLFSHYTVDNTPIDLNWSSDSEQPD